MFIDGPFYVVIRAFWDSAHQGILILTEFNGFTTLLIPSNSGKFEYLYLMKSGKKIVSISAFYHGNYSEMKQRLEIKVKFLGEEPFRLLTEVKKKYQFYNT